MSTTMVVESPADTSKLNSAHDAAETAKHNSWTSDLQVFNFIDDQGPI